MARSDNPSTGLTDRFVARGTLVGLYTRFHNQISPGTLRNVVELTMCSITSDILEAGSSTECNVPHGMFRCFRDAISTHLFIYVSECVRACVCTHVATQDLSDRVFQ